jgi:phage-related protein
VSLRVMPDTKKFRSDLESDLERLERALQIDIPAALDTSALDKQARQAGAELERLGRKIGDDLADGIERGLGEPLEAPLEKSTRKSQRKAPAQGAKTGGAFAEGFSRRVQAALSSLPEAEITADSTDADLKLQVLRKSLAELGDKKIGVDIQADTARAELAVIRSELAGLAETASVDVRMNTAAAIGQLNAFEADLARMDKNIEIDVDVDRGRAQLGGLVEDAAKAGGGITSALSGAFSSVSNNVIIMSLAIGAALGALPFAAGIAAVGIVAALGGGLAFLGLKIASENKKVKKSFTDLKTHVVGELRKLAKPFEATLLSISKTARKVFDKMAPELGKSFQKIAPAMTRFADSVGKALLKLEPAIGPITDAFVKLMDALGPQLPVVFQDIADAFIELANTISEDPEMFAKLISGLIGLLPKAVRVINFFAQTLEKLDEFLTKVKNALTGLPEKVRAAIEGIVTGVTGLPGKVGAALASFGTTVSTAVTSAWERAKTATTTAVNTVATFVRELPGKAAAALSTLGSTVGTAVTSAWTRAKTNTTTGINNVVAFIRGLPAKAAAALSTLATTLGGLATSAWNRAKTATTTGINNVVAYVRGLPGKARAAASALITNLGTLATQAFARMRSSASSGVNTVVSVVRGIPGRIRSALGNLGGLLYSAGRSVIQGLINGIRSMIGSVGSAMSSIASTIRSRLPFSPAKEGPLRTHPPDKAGRTIARMIADGLATGEHLVARAASGIAAATLPDIDGQLQTSPTRGRGGLGGLTVNNYYPQAEPTSKSMNRALQYAAALGTI